MLKVARRYAEQALDEAAEKADVLQIDYHQTDDNQKINCVEIWEDGHDIPSYAAVVDKYTILNLKNELK